MYFALKCFACPRLWRNRGCSLWITSLNLPKSAVGIVKKHLFLQKYICRGARWLYLAPCRGFRSVCHPLHSRRIYLIKEQMTASPGGICSPAKINSMNRRMIQLRCQRQYNGRFRPRYSNNSI